MPIHLRLTIVAATALALTLGGASTAPASKSMAVKASAGPEQLWDKAFGATSVEGRRGKKAPLVRPVHIVLYFRSELTLVPGQVTEPGLSFGGCNRKWADLQIVGDTLQVDEEIITTKKKCPKPSERADKWLVEFFASDPHWWLDGTRLKLWVPGVVMKFEEVDCDPSVSYFCPYR